MSSLYSLRGDFANLYYLITEEDDEQAFIDTLEALRGELSVKAEGCVHVIKQFEMEAGECDKVIEAFQRKKEIRLNAVKRIKEAIIKTLDAAELDAITAGDYQLKITKNGGLQPLKIDGPVPDNFKKIIYEDDKELIRKALNEGQELDFAHLEPRGRHLNIK